MKNKITLFNHKIKHNFLRRFLTKLVNIINKILTKHLMLVFNVHFAVTTNIV